MKTKLLTSIFILILYNTGFAQVGVRIQGQVFFDKTAATKVEIINATSKTVVLTDTDGKFAINIDINDILVFVAKNHDIKEIKISVKVLNQGALKVSLNPKAEELKEVVVQSMPSIKLSKNAKWEQDKLDKYTLEKNAKSLKNSGVYTGTIENGMDLMRIGDMIFKLFRKEKDTVKKVVTEPIDFITLAKTNCDQKFYIENLKLKPEEIPLFLQFCEADPKSKRLLENSNVLAIMDFLSTKNIEFKKL